MGRKVCVPTNPASVVDKVYQSIIEWQLFMDVLTGGLGIESNQHV